jgi:purine catabolism regulator
LSAADRHLVNAAVMLLTLGVEQDAVAPDVAAPVRTAALELALSGHLDLARSIAARVGTPLPDDPVVVLVARARPGRAPQPGADHPAPRGSTSPNRDWWDEGRRPQRRSPQPAGAALSADLDGELVVVSPAIDADRTAADLAAAGLTVGLSGETAADALADAHRQARQAADAATGRGIGVLTFDSIGASGITGLWDAGQAAAFAESLLAPLVAHDRTGRGDLVASLREWLAHHGQWDPAAAALGVHRHTLRRRMGLAAQLLDRDLDSPTVRSELWLALVMTGSAGESPH